MKKIFVLGCSNSVGTEVYDEYLFDNYWDFTKPSNRAIKKIGTCFERFMDNNKAIEKIYDGDMSLYEKDCLTLAWPTILNKYYKDKNIEVLNYSKSGSGIDFFHMLYHNMNPYEDTVLQRERKDFKKHIINSDLLIWQVTDEPRFTLTYKNNDMLILCTDISQIRDRLRDVETSPFKIKNWKKKVYIDFYETGFHSKRFFREKLNFLNFILYQRILKKKHTIIPAFYETNFEKAEYEFIDSEYVHYMGFEKSGGSRGLIVSLINEKKLEFEKAYCKFGHPAQEAHKAIFNHIKNYINEKQLI